uniref:Uncharacterized protein n=1 Tax=Anguilla anguilla TaxID=7936 RepID=A0A0E9WW88_ANGAN
MTKLITCDKQGCLKYRIQVIRVPGMWYWNPNVSPVILFFLSFFISFFPYLAGGLLCPPTQGRYRTCICQMVVL